MYQNMSYQFFADTLSGAPTKETFLANGVPDMQDLLLEQQWVSLY